MPGFMPGIHVFTAVRTIKDVDGRDKPGHDEEKYQSLGRYTRIGIST
jgi:hypothetical protein